MLYHYIQSGVKNKHEKVKHSTHESLATITVITKQIK